MMMILKCSFIYSWIEYKRRNKSNVVKCRISYVGNKIEKEKKISWHMKVGYLFLAMFDLIHEEIIDDLEDWKEKKKKKKNKILSNERFETDVHMCIYMNIIWM